jgi:hypothetical protein
MKDQTGLELLIGLDLVMGLKFSDKPFGVLVAN